MNPKKMNKEQLIAKVDELQAKVDNLLTQSREADELNEEKASAIDNLKNKIAELDEQIEEKNTEIHSLNHSIEGYRGTIHDQTKELQTLRKQVTSIREDAQGMETKIAELTLANSKLKVWKYVAVGAIVAFLICLCVICA